MLFNIATESQIGKGNTTLFWLDKWISGIQSGLSLIGLVEFFHLWDIMQEKKLLEEED
jgi:hypothetical protein